MISLDCSRLSALALSDPAFMSGSRFVVTKEKRPFQPDGKAASATDPRTWRAYETVRRAYEAGRRLKPSSWLAFDGIGRALASDEFFGVIDLDHCYSAGKWTGTELAKHVCEIFAAAGAWPELSTSGTGAHLWFRYRQRPACMAALDTATHTQYSLQDKPRGVELYLSARYMKLTGVWAGDVRTVSKLGDCQVALEELAKILTGNDGPQIFTAGGLVGADGKPLNNNAPVLVDASGQPITGDSSTKPEADSDGAAMCGLSDKEIIKCLTAKGIPNRKYNAELWGGVLEHWQAESKSQDTTASGADMAFACACLYAFDRPTAEAVFRRSALGRRDKSARSDYIRRTFDSAERSVVLARRERQSAADSGEKLTEYQVAKRVMTEHKLIFTEKIGFNEYVFEAGGDDPQAGIWRPRTVTTIEKYTADVLGEAQTNRQIEAAAKLVRRHTQKPLYDDARLFNNANMLNLANGMLDLDTLELKPHAPEYYSSIQLPYSYDPDARAPVFEAALREILDNDEAKYRFFLQSLGYIFYPDNSLNKAFFWIGEGANGKSFLINVLSAVFGGTSHGAVTTIGMEGLADKFQRIGLMNSLANFASETKLISMKAAQDALKRIAGNDSVNGCFKGRDFVTFKPRVKLFFALNRLPDSDDLSNGLARRLAVFNLPNTFVDDPRGLHQIKVNRGLEAYVIKNELAGVLNLAVAGYRDLRASNGEFAETAESRKLVAEYRGANDPVQAFIEDTFANKQHDQITRSDLFKQYKDWSDINNYKPLPQGKFTIEVRKHLEALGYDVDECYIGKERAFIIERLEHDTPAPTPVTSQVANAAPEKPRAAVEQAAAPKMPKPITNTEPVTVKRDGQEHPRPRTAQDNPELAIEEYSADGQLHAYDYDGHEIAPTVTNASTSNPPALTGNTGTGNKSTPQQVSSGGQAPTDTGQRDNTQQTDTGGQQLNLLPKPRDQNTDN